MCSDPYIYLAMPSPFSKFKGLALAAMIGCSGPQDPSQRSGPPEINIESSPAWTHTEQFKQDIQQQIVEALKYWNGSQDDIAGLLIRVIDSNACGTNAGGCARPFEGEVEVATKDATTYGQCSMMVPVIHELGHVILYSQTGDADADHSDPRWPGLESLYLRLKSSNCP